MPKKILKTKNAAVVLFLRKKVIPFIEGNLINKS